MKRLVNAYAFRPKRRRGGKLRVSPTWWMRYRLNGETRYTSVNLHVRDKQVAEQKVAEFRREREQEAQGIIAPKPLREAARRPMADHLRDYVAVLKSERHSPMYVYNVERHVTKLLGECAWSLPKDVTAESFESWRCGQKKKGKTLNDYLADARGLLSWMRRTGRLNADPLACVQKIDTRGQEQLRRALTDDEFAKLLAVAGRRRAVYFTAGYTGLRRGELRQLQWGDVHLDAPRPFLNVRASTSKNRKAATIWLIPEVVAELRTLRPADASEGAPVFPKLVPKMTTFRRHLAKAKIAEKDGQGRVVVFHCLRHTLGTNLARAGVAPVVAMQIMRHSDPRLTMKTYTDASQLPTADAMERLPLPRLNTPGTEPQAARATGTDGAGSGTQKDAQTPAQAGPRRSIRVQVGTAADSPQLACESADSPELSAAVTAGQSEGESWGTRIRT